MFRAGEAIDISRSSIFRWDLHLEPFRQIGNGPRASIFGVDLLNLITYIAAWPDSTIDEMAAFIFNMLDTNRPTTPTIATTTHLKMTQEMTSTPPHNPPTPSALPPPPPQPPTHLPLGIQQLMRYTIQNAGSTTLPFAPW